MIIKVIIQDTCLGFNYPKRTEMRILIWYDIVQVLKKIKESQWKNKKIKIKKTEEKEIKKRKEWRVKARNTSIRGRGEEEAERKHW